LGIDPGYALIGYGILKKENKNIEVLEYGAIRTVKGDPGERLVNIYHKIVNIIDSFSPDVLSLEKLFFNKNAKTVLGVGEARGVIILSAKLKGLSIREYTPLEVKQAMTGYGRATKQQVQYMVKSILKFEKIPKPDDVADALAIALTCIYMERFDKIK